MAARASPPPTVYGALQTLKRTGQLPAETYGEDTATYTAALTAAKHLSGLRRAELENVVANVQQMAAAGDFIPSRLPALMLTLQSNTQWWSHQPIPGADQHVTVPGSHLVWEHYPGQGIEIQWLATFGEANGYYDNGHDNTQLREVLEEAIPLATQRAGGIAWEYFFHFDGGAPPWTSGLSQGTALQALSRAYVRLHEPAFLTAATQALGIFQTPPPAGVRVAQPAGTLYAEYTYAPTDRILNGFIQALNGLYEYAKLTGDPLGRQLFEAGDAEARAITPSYNTSAWSKYDQHTESNLNYHELLTEFLVSLCQRSSEGEPGPPAATPAAIPGDQVYCTTAERFTADLHTPPVLELLTHKLPEGARGGVQIELSKVANVSIAVREGVKVVWTNSALVEGGDPRLLWVTPSKAGTYTVSVTATDLAGNTASTSGTIALGAPVPARTHTRTGAPTKRR
ncbi:MAG TPA: D-glucuronyl C5-epimerase family protein [Solirubrobacteraceae bacterium]|nr:D-glucuronyl C5-epimerase family protein [Solirubrobacteraceae bacterium]